MSTPETTTEEDWDEEEPASPDQALANFRQSVTTAVRSGIADEEVLSWVETAFGFRPTPEQWARFKAAALGESHDR